MGKKVVLGLIHLYQRYISPFLPQSCRFYPSCAEYACQSIKKYGVVKGASLSFCRILRCSPWHSGGYDPIK